MPGLLVWLVIPALVWGGLMALIRTNGERRVVPHVVLLLLVEVAVLLLGPTCLCRDPMDALLGNIAFAAVLSCALFGVGFAALRVFRRG